MASAGAAGGAALGAVAHCVVGVVDGKALAGGVCLHLLGQSALDIKFTRHRHMLVASGGEVAVGVVGKGLLEEAVAAQRVRKSLLDDAAQRVAVVGDATAQWVLAPAQVAAAVVAITPGLAPVVHLLDDAAQCIALELVGLATLVAHAYQLFFGVVEIVHRVAVRLDAAGQLALAKVFEPSGGAVLVDVLGEVVLGVVAAAHHRAGWQLHRQQAALGVVAVLGAAVQRITLGHQVAQGIVRKQGAVAQRVGDLGQMAAQVVLQAGAGLARVDIGAQLTEGVVFIAADMAQRGYLLHHQPTRIEALLPGLARRVGDLHRPVVGIEAGCHGHAVGPHQRQQVAALVVVIGVAMATRVGHCGGAAGVVILVNRHAAQRIDLGHRQATLVQPDQRHMAQ